MIRDVANILMNIRTVSSLTHALELHGFSHLMVS